MQDLIDTLSESFEGEIVYDGEKVFYVKSIKQSEEVPGFVSLDVDDGRGPLHLRKSKAGARSLKLAEQIRTVGDLAEAVVEDTLGISKGHYDLALPPWFANEVSNETSKWTAWVYDDKAGVMGRPQPLTRVAYYPLAVIDEDRGTDYETEALFPHQTVRDCEQMYLIEQ
jgi:hypothetical protein